jgi:leucyl/phenylalanyl-tRNA---protein transferase
MLAAMQLAWLDECAPFPPTAAALDEHSDAPGLLAAGGGLSIARLTGAYRQGIFPWYAEGQPVLWWSPDPRMVLPVAEFSFRRSLRKSVQSFLSQPGCSITFDHRFSAVIESCARMPREGQDGTWIVPAMLRAYGHLHEVGVAHSIEIWVDGELAGGLYGLLIGRMFFGESMFARRTDSSKIALSALVAFCRRNGIELIDCQQHTRHLASLGARAIPRHAFERHLKCTVDAETPRWTYDQSLWTELGLKSASLPTDPP